MLYFLCSRKMSCTHRVRIFYFQWKISLPSIQLRLKQINFIIYSSWTVWASKVLYHSWYIVSISSFIILKGKKKLKLLCLSKYCTVRGDSCLDPLYVAAVSWEEGMTHPRGLEWLPAHLLQPTLIIDKYYLLITDIEEKHLPTAVTFLSILTCVNFLSDP